MERNLTVGSVPKILFQFAVPLFFSNVLQALYNVVDMLVVGRFVGSAGLAAISSASVACFIIYAFCIGITAGAAVLVAQYKGANNRQGQTDTMQALFFVSAGASILITLLGRLTYHPLFIFMNVPAESMQYADEYMEIICLGTIFIFGYNAVSALMRGLGDSRSPLWFVAIGATTNIILDVILVGYYDWATTGAAIATIASQGIAFLCSFLYLKKHYPLFNCSYKSFVIYPEVAKQILKIGLPVALQMCVINLAYIIVTGMLNLYGVAVAAASGIGLKINSIVALPCWAIGTATTAMAGQNIGAGKIGRARETAIWGVKFSILILLPLVVLIQLFTEECILLFDNAPDVAKQGILYLRICCSINFVAYGVMYIMDSFATGVGHAKFAMYNAVSQAVIRLCSGWLLAEPLAMGFVGIYWGEFISPLLPAIVGIAFFYKGNWQKKIN